MRIIRYKTATDVSRFGWVMDDLVGPIEGSPYGEYRRLEAVTPLDQVHLLPPVRPSKILCVGRNYVAHAREHDAEVPQIPLLFLKPPS